jgi:hypothetical protein
MVGGKEGEVPSNAGSLSLKPRRILDPELDYAPTMLRMEVLWKTINDKFLHKDKSTGLDAACLELTQLATRLLYLAEVRLHEIKEDKVIHAAHPSFHP